MPSFFMIKEKISPPVPQAPKQCQLCCSGKTKKEGGFSLWKGHKPLKLRPAFCRVTYSETSSTISNLCFTSVITLMDISLHLILAHIGRSSEQGNQRLRPTNYPPRRPI